MGVESGSNQEVGFDPELFLAQHGLEDLAGLQVEAHGGVYSVKEALAECPPFANMVTAMAASLEFVPDRKDILQKTISSMASRSGELPPDAKKKLN